MYLLYVCLSVKLMLTKVNAQYIFDVTGADWTQTIAASAIVEAGLDYNQSSRTSTATHTQISYYNIWGLFFAGPRNFSMTMEVSKNDISWDNQIALWVRRTGDGTQPGTPCTSGGFVSGGTYWQQVTNTATSFFTGQCRRSNVPIQLEMRNISVVVPTGTKSTTIVYTVTFVQL